MPQRGKRSLMTPYARGYTRQMRDTLDRMPIPNEIKCYICKRRRPRSQYSNNQLNYLRQAMFETGYNNIQNQTVAKCGPCTNAQVCEDRCHRCGHYRAIDQFARNQRSRDTPICQPCMNYQLSLDPNEQPRAIEAAQEEDEDEDDELNTGSMTFSDSGSASQLEVQLEGQLESSQWSFSESFEKPLVLRDDFAEPNVKGKVGGFARVKAHRPVQAPVPEPEPAPGWAAGTRKIDDGKPFRGAKFL